MENQQVINWHGEDGINWRATFGVNEEKPCIFKIEY